MNHIIEKIVAAAIIGLGVVCVITLLSLLLALPVKWLWNWLMPELFGLKSITWLQAFGLNTLSGLLIRSSSSSSSWPMKAKSP